MSQPSREALTNNPERVAATTVSGVEQDAEWGLEEPAGGVWADQFAWEWKTPAESSSEKKLAGWGPSKDVKSWL